MKNKVANLNQELSNYRELMSFSLNNYKENIAYEYKKDPTAKTPKYIRKTYKEVVNDVKAVGTALLNLKEKNKISKILLIGSNRYEWVLSYFAITTSGLVVAPMDKLLPSKEIKSLVERSGVEAVICEEKYIEQFKELKQDKSNKLEIVICMDNVNDKEVINLPDLLRNGRKSLKNKDKKYDKVKIDNNAMSIMLFTSGTTDKSKIVMLSQKNICSNIWAYQNHFKMREDDVLLSFLPINHTFESSITIVYGFYCGSCIAFCDGLRHIQQNLVEYKVSIFVAVPLVLETMHKKINKGIEAQGKTELINKLMKFSNILLKCHIDIRRKLFKQIIDQFGGRLRIMLYGAASLDKDTIKGFNNIGIDSIQGYGLTETSPVLVAESESRHKPGSCGYPLDNVEIKILEPDKQGIGEIAAKGPNVMIGYYEDEAKTKAAFTDDGWFKTGDFGYIDKDGFLYITGRKKDIIVLRNGKNVYPQELEFLVNKLPYVTESMVFSREESETDTQLVAKIVYDKDEIAKEYGEKTQEDYKKQIWKDIKEINKTLPTFKHIKQIIITTEPMEKTTTQKVKRYEEIKKAEKEMANS